MNNQNDQLQNNDQILANIMQYSETYQSDN